MTRPRSNKSDLHLHLGPASIKDQAASEASCLVDAATDRRWFEQHPDVNERERRASSRELRAAGLPAGVVAIVIVTRGPCGSLIRALCEPETQQN